MTLGARYGYTKKDRRVTPRLAVIYAPTDRTAMKFLAGQGFRRPGVYERFFERTGDETLAPEVIQTLEFVMERRVTPDVLLTASLFNIDLDRVLREEYGNPGFHNAGEVRSRGIELQADYRRGDGVWSYLSYTFQRASENDVPMLNSPTHLIKGGVSTPTSGSLQGALELQYESSRQTRAGAATNNALVVNLNLTKALTPHLTLGVTVRNLFDTDYATPGGPEHVQDVIAQDGRTFVVRLIATGR